MTSYPPIKIVKFVWKNERAVSPVVATILMVAITVVLAGVLVAYLNTLPSGSGNVEPPIGARVEKTGQGNWTLDIVTGKTLLVDIYFQVVDGNTGVKTISELVTAESWYFHFNNNNENGYLDPGDKILMNRTAGYLEIDFRVQLIKNGSTLTGPIVIPG